jgi:hypothetical protein
MQVERTNVSDLLIDALPDGSRVITDPKSETVFALNATAGAAWDACGVPTNPSQVAREMQRSLTAAVSEEVALDAILQLQEKNLVTITDSPALTTRRQLVASLAAVALPLVVSLTVAEQKAHASTAKSTPKGPTPPKPTPLPIRF